MFGRKATNQTNKILNGTLRFSYVLGNDCDQFNYLLNSDGPIVKAVARFFYTANMTNNT